MKSIRYVAVAIAAFALGFALAHTLGVPAAQAQADLKEYLGTDPGSESTTFTVRKEGQAFIILSSGAESSSGERAAVAVKHESVVLDQPQEGFVVFGPVDQYWRVGVGPDKQCPIHPAGGPDKDCPFPPGPFREMILLMDSLPAASQ